VRERERERERGGHETEIEKTFVARIRVCETSAVRHQQTNKMEDQRKESLAGLTKYYGDALKHALPRMGHASSDYPTYFLAMETSFPFTEFRRKFNQNYLFHYLMNVAKLC